jgi:cytochrome c556
MGRALRAVVIVGVVSALGLAGCASGKSSTASTDPVADRQRLMKLHGALWKDLQDKHKAGNIEAMEVDAEALALNAKRIPSLFPEGSMTEKSKAKAEIWQKWPEFESAAKNLETQSVKLRDSAKAKDTAAVDAQMKDFGRNACGTCHTPFRVPPPRQG